MTARTSVRLTPSQLRWTVLGQARRAVRALPGALRFLAPILAWAATSIALGFIVGFAAIILPPTGAFGIVAVLGLVLLWAMPDLAAVPTKLVRPAFLAVLVVFFCLPNYYAFSIPGLPWISARRLVIFVLIMLFAIVISGSSKERARIGAELWNAKALSICAFGFLGMAIVSVFTSITPSASLPGVTDAILEWYVPLCALIFVVRSEEDVILVLRIIGWSSILVAAAAAFNIVTGRNIFIEMFPRSMLNSLAESNPAVAAMIGPQSGGGVRNGTMRVASLFTTPLSLGEFAAITAPIGYFFAVHRPKMSDRIFGVVVAVTSVMAVYCSGSRGGYACLILGTALFAALWVVRKARFDSRSLAPALGGLCAVIGFAILLALILFWPRLHNMVLGGGDAAYSDEGRRIQWALGTPKIEARPLTGYGWGMSGLVVGYYNGPSEIPSIDSFVLALLVETGVPGFLLYFGMIMAGVWFGVRSYLSNRTLRGAIAGPLACSLFAYGFYRIYLSQRENQTLFFIILGLLIWLTAPARLQRSSTKPVRQSIVGKTDLEGTFVS